MTESDIAARFQRIMGSGAVAIGFGINKSSLKQRKPPMSTGPPMILTSAATICPSLARSMLPICR